MKLRFTLRALAVFVLLFALGLGWWVNTVRSQRLAVAAIERLDGHVSNADTTQSLMNRPFYPSWLPDSLERVYPMDINYIYLTGEEITDEHLGYILAFPDLEGINLSATSISDKSLQRLQHYGDLKVLQLYDVETVTPSGIADFQRSLPDCEIWR